MPEEVNVRGRVKRTAEQIFLDGYICKTELNRLRKEGWKATSRIYELALANDNKTIPKERRIYTDGEKVSLESVAWVLGKSVEELKKAVQE